MNSTKNRVVQLVVNATEGAAGTSDISSDEVDMQGFESVEFLAAFGTITAGAVTTIKAQQDIVTGMGTAADLLGTSMTVADDEDDTIFRLEIVRPRERFVRLVISRATQNAVVASVIAILSNPREAPITDHADVTASETHLSPAEGTA